MKFLRVVPAIFIMAGMTLVYSSPVQAQLFGKKSNSQKEETNEGGQRYIDEGAPSLIEMSDEEKEKIKEYAEQIQQNVRVADEARKVSTMTQSVNLAHSAQKADLPTGLQESRKAAAVKSLSSVNAPQDTNRPVKTDALKNTKTMKKTNEIQKVTRVIP